MSNRCRILAWDSAFFGRRIARVEGERLSHEEFPPIADWCTQEGIECLYFLADSRCPSTLDTLEAYGFGLKDLRTTYEWKSALGARGIHPQIADAVRVRTSTEADLDQLAEIARGAHTDSRFFFDRRFDPDKAASLYDIWIRQACANDHVFVGETDGRPAGYLSCQRSGPTSGSIGLAAVDPRCHGQGIGRAMMEAGLRWFAEQGISDITVVTQGRNVLAHRFYQSAGFLTRAIECWFHKWFEPIRSDSRTPSLLPI